MLMEISTTEAIQILERRIHESIANASVMIKDYDALNALKIEDAVNKGFDKAREFSNQIYKTAIEALHYLEQMAKELAKINEILK